MGTLGEVKSLSQNFLHDGNSFSFQTYGFSFQARVWTWLDRSLEGVFFLRKNWIANPDMAVGCLKPPIFGAIEQGIELKALRLTDTVPVTGCKPSEKHLAFLGTNDCLAELPGLVA